MLLFKAKFTHKYFAAIKKSSIFPDSVRTDLLSVKLLLLLFEIFDRKIWDGSVLRLSSGIPALDPILLYVLQTAITLFTGLPS